MSLAEGLNQGRLFNESPCVPTNFFMGGGMNPVRGLTAQLKWLQKKIDAGAKFIFTQPVYREEDVDSLLEATAEFTIPILVGIMPLTSRRNAEFFAAGKIPGIIIPKEIVDRFEHYDDPVDGRKLGLQLALELQEKIKNKVRGLYLLPPFGASAYDTVRQMVRELDLRRPLLASVR
jgi:5,10-methylenetetrahydrofolate reductase